jgi:uncharacterized protein (TIGR03435 family)
MKESTVKKIALLSLLVLPAFGQQPQPPQSQLKFEAADVHVSPTARGFAQNFGGVLREGRYVNRDATMINLITAAYGVSEDGVAGGPGWISSDLFDIIAKVPDGTKIDTANLMLRNLLAERFKLVIESGTHPVPRYVITVAKGGPKLKSSSGTGAGCQPVGGGGAPPGGDLASIPNIKVSCHNMTAKAMAENFRQMANGYFDHDAVDSTKLEGAYDFELEWTPRAALAAKGSDGIGIFDAIEKQLGLKVQLQDVPVPSMVVASVNRKPSPNSDGIATILNVAAARFEAATIKPANPNDPRPLNGLLYTGGSQMRSGGTLPFLIAMSLQIPPGVAEDMVVGVPKALQTQRWDITAKVPATGEGAPNVVNGRPLPPPLSVGLEMLRNLLVDQFGLKTHSENREVTVYALTLSGGKHKMAKADDSERSGCRPDPNAPKPATNIPAMISCKNTSMAELAQTLQQQGGGYFDHPVADATGLEGGWNFLIGWSPRPNPQQQPGANPNPNQPAAAAEPSDPNGISAFDAIERELGLKAVKQKRSIPVIVVDHVNDKPEN